MELKAFLKKNGISMRQFAAAIDVNAGSISLYANKKMAPTLEVAAKIHFASKGEVGMLDLLPKKKSESVKRIIKFLDEKGFEYFSKKKRVVCEEHSRIQTVASIEL